MLSGAAVSLRSSPVDRSYFNDSDTFRICTLNHSLSQARIKKLKVPRKSDWR